LQRLFEHGLIVAEPGYVTRRLGAESIRHAFPCAALDATRLWRVRDGSVTHGAEFL
jgi:hypothetical protein